MKHAFGIILMLAIVFLIMQLPIPFSLQLVLCFLAGMAAGAVTDIIFD